MEVRGIGLSLVAVLGVLGDLGPCPSGPTLRPSSSPNVRWAALPHEQFLDMTNLDVYGWGLVI